jgi:hypothetical protein
MVTLGPVELASRDIAALFWWAVVAALAVSSSAARSSVGDLLRAVLRLVAILLLFSSWVAIVALLATRIPFPLTGNALWGIGQIKETVAWFFVAGLTKLLSGFPQAAAEEHWYVRRMLATASVAALLDFYLGLVTFPLPVEILLPIPFVLLVYLTSPLVVKTEHGRQRAQRVQAAAGLLLIAGTGWLIIDSLPRIDWAEQVRDWTLAAYLTLGALPFVTWLSLFSEYQQALLRMRRRDDERVALRAKLALAAAFRGRARELHRFVHPWVSDLAEAEGFRAGLAVIRRFRADMAQRDAAERKKAEDLVRYAGNPGTDDEGRRLDRREFAETIEALESISFAQMGWYRNEPEGRYKLMPDAVLSALARGLPDDHGIQMRVRPKGRSWYAWRRTVSGWVFAVGAAAPPSDQRFSAEVLRTTHSGDSNVAWPADEHR